MGAILIVALLASPAWATLRLTDRYFYADWQSCAAYLADKVSPDDVIMVLEDRPLGGYQPTFWGKHEWPEGFDRPLAEAVWTFATSESHWRRLLEKPGRTFMVIRQPVRNAGRDDYLREGLRVAPEGMILAKFRGIDLLYHARIVSDPMAERLAACDILIDLVFENTDVAAIPGALRGRLLVANGDFDAAAEGFRRAVEQVPPERKAWFAAATRPIADALATGTE